MNAAQRLEAILNYYGINAKSLSEKCGYGRPQGIYDVQNGKTKEISTTMANKILSVFPELNRVWLLTGEGNMINERNNSSIIDSNNNNRGIIHSANEKRNILNMHNICTRYYKPIYSFSSKVTSIPTISQYLRKFFKLTFFPLSMALTVPKFIPCFQILYWDSPFSSRILRTCFDNSSIVILLLIPSLSPLKMR